MNWEIQAKWIVIKLKNMIKTLSHAYKERKGSTLEFWRVIPALRVNRKDLLSVYHIPILVKNIKSVAKIHCLTLNGASARGLAGGRILRD